MKKKLSAIQSAFLKFETPWWLTDNCQWWIKDVKKKKKRGY